MTAFTVVTVWHFGTNYRNEESERDRERRLFAIDIIQQMYS